MFVSHVTPELWHLPTPFRDSSFGRITISIKRPNLRSVVFLALLINPAEAILGAVGLQHHGVVSNLTYTACVVLAVGIGRVIADLGRTERPARVCTCALGVAALWFDGSVPGTAVAPLVAVGSLLALTAAGELGYQLTTRYGGDKR